MDRLAGAVALVMDNILTTRMVAAAFQHRGLYDNSHFFQCIINFRVL